MIAVLRVLAWLAYTLLSALPPAAASAAMGAVARAIGPHLGLSRRAHRNLRRAMPELSEAERRAIVSGMWDNLGRLVGEFPHLDALWTEGRIELIGREHIEALRDDGVCGLFFSAHLANWELCALAAGLNGLPVSLLYRAANDPVAEDIYRRGRAAATLDLIPKGRSGARRALKVLQAGGHLGMLLDQKMNDGIAVPFFGRDAMTAPAMAQFALKFDCPVVPTRVVRLGGCRFRVEVCPPMTITRSGDHHADVKAIMTEVNRMIEAWVREHPDQWLWLHRRWPDQ